MLFLVATPIGNLADITQRAIETLRSVDCIAAEDTRHTGILLQRLSISKPLISFHEHNEASRTVDILERLSGGQSIAVVSDAGMPGMSDPGLRLVRACIARGIPYTIIPGPSAPAMALIGSGFETVPHYFGGFLPVKSGQRLRELSEAIERSCTSLYFESPYRIQKTLAALAEIAPERLVCAARELTKKFEEFRRGTSPDLAAQFARQAPKGEITLVIEGGVEFAKRLASRPPEHCPT